MAFTSARNRWFGIKHCSGNDSALLSGCGECRYQYAAFLCTVYFCDCVSPTHSPRDGSIAGQTPLSPLYGPLLYYSSPLMYSQAE